MALVITRKVQPGEGWHNCLVFFTPDEAFQVFTRPGAAAGEVVFHVDAPGWTVQRHPARLVLSRGRGRTVTIRYRPAALRDEIRCAIEAPPDVQIKRGELLRDPDLYTPDDG